MRVTLGFDDTSFSPCRSGPSLYALAAYIRQTSSNQTSLNSETSWQVTALNVMGCKLVTAHYTVLTVIATVYGTCAMHFTVHSGCGSTYCLLSIPGQVCCSEQGVDTGASHPREGSCCHNCHVSAWIPQCAVFFGPLLLGSPVLSLRQESNQGAAKCLRGYKSHQCVQGKTASRY